MAPPPPDTLSGLPLGPIRYFESIDSTNSYAATWAQAGAPDLAFVIADEQTAGKGRQGRSWQTPADSALAFSLVLKPGGIGQPLGRYAALGALAVQDTLAGTYNLPAAIKWPNDVLLDGAKVCGVLAEADWQGDRLSHVILGIGVNVRPAAVPPAARLRFPATSIETALGRPQDRWLLLRQFLEALLGWRARLHLKTFVSAWEKRLAFLGEQVRVGDHQGQLAGLTSEGHLRLVTPAGELVFPMGEISLTPLTG
jgi:BirA family biotin operon repressor/biotin-[acetyl-CoA-carboxylase] ligase